MEDRQKKKVDLSNPRFSYSEIAVIKKYFSENADLLSALKVFFYQGELTDYQKKLIQFVNNDEAIAILRKVFVLDYATGHEPIMQSVDIFSSAFAPDDIVITAVNKILVRENIRKYLEQQLDVLAKGSTPTMMFKDFYVIETEDMEKTYINISTKNLLCQFIDQNLWQLDVIAGTEEETPEDAVNRLKKNSSK